MTSLGYDALIIDVNFASYATYEFAASKSASLCLHRYVIGQGSEV